MEEDTDRLRPHEGPEERSTRVDPKEEMEPAYTWDHYIAVPDAEDREGRSFGNKARRVVGEFWVSRRTILVNSYHIFETF